jgi:phage shock protein C
MLGAMFTMSDPHPSQTPTPPPRRSYRFVRSRADRKLGGICGAIARDLDADATIVRIVVLVVALVTGVGVLAYLLAWILAPAAAEGAETVAARGSLGRLGSGWEGRQVAGAVLLALGALLLLDRVGLGIDAGVTIPLLMVAGGVAVLLQRRNDLAEASHLVPTAPAPSPPSPPPAGPTPAAGPVSMSAIAVSDGTDGRPDDGGPDDGGDGFDSGGDGGSGGGPAPTPGGPSPSPLGVPWSHPDVQGDAMPDETARVIPPAKPQQTPDGPPDDRLVAMPPFFSTPGAAVPGSARPGISSMASRVPAVAPRRVWPRIAWAMLLFGVAAAFLIVQRTTVAPVVVAASFVIGIGAALVIGAWAGRPGGFVFLGIISALMMLFFAIAEVSWRGPIGDRTVTPTNETLRAVYRQRAGVLRLDFSRLDLRGKRADVDVEVGAGGLAIEIPEDVGVVFDGRSGFGALLGMTGVDEGGVAYRRRVVIRERNGAGVMYLRARVGAGAMEIARVGDLRDITPTNVRVEVES